MSHAPSPALARFFETLGPYLDGTRTLDEVSASLGEGPDGEAGLAYYRTLVARNHLEILGDVFGSVRAVVRARHGAEAWRGLARAYATEHPRAAHDPNDFAEAFPGFLERQALVDDGAALAELADFHWICHRCAVAPDPAADDDGLESRLFVRQYSFDVPRWRRAVTDDTPAALEFGSRRESRATFVVVFRHLQSDAVEVLRPTRAQLQAIGRRAHADAADALGADDDELSRAHESLARLGVLRP